ncbi:MAG: NAD-dependent epimerase/dehydratase family protein [Planctomycetota bacterium]|nr:NAD-dependent epimerase/dehydratase family protein [Planctomycetota bacterium]MDP6764119.1 NAD-dependent epimerase/dehydratase family protein [Planctomycetota bacterium]MDP6989592.1 NAD-dependent epimerase/dehydratase family protein [Planctomycetota bacterium]
MRVLVTGGGGFVGGAVIEELAARGHEPTSLSRGAYPDLARKGVACVQADLADADALRAALRGQDAVVHCAARAGVWGPRAEYWRTNVEGTRNLLAACVAAGVERLVHTSSPSVCFDGRDHLGAGNDLPPARRFLAHYPASKAAAERGVLAAAERGELLACVLRPHLVFGPGDPHLLPRLVERARSGRLAIVGDGENEVSVTFVENAAVAHVDALERLAPGAAHVGRAYFVGQREPVRLWDWIADLLGRLGVAPPRRRLSAATARALGSACEWTWRGLRLAGEPPMTRFVAAQLATSHSYDLEPLERDVGYRERVGMDEGLERTIAWLRAPAAATVKA